MEAPAPNKKEEITLVSAIIDGRENDVRVRAI